MSSLDCLYMYKTVYRTVHCTVLVLFTITVHVYLYTTVRVTAEFV